MPGNAHRAILGPPAKPTRNRCVLERFACWDVPPADGTLNRLRRARSTSGPSGS